MKEPLWIDLMVVHTVQEALLSRFGGAAGVRDEGLLESALARPKQLHHYSECDLFDLAASYAYGLVKNHPFIDGNKRAGFVVGALFLEQNGCGVTVSEQDAVLQTLALAAGELDEKGYADWLRSACE